MIGFSWAGHCDSNLNILAVAIKEAQEESGIKNIVPISNKIFDIDIHPIPENKREKAHKHFDIRFLLKVNSNEQEVKNNESKELKWFIKDKVKLPTQKLSILIPYQDYL